MLLFAARRSRISSPTAQCGNLGFEFADTVGFGKRKYIAAVAFVPAQHEQGQPSAIRA